MAGTDSAPVTPGAAPVRIADCSLPGTALPNSPLAMVSAAIFRREGVRSFDAIFRSRNLFDSFFTMVCPYARSIAALPRPSAIKGPRKGEGK